MMMCPGICSVKGDQVVETVAILSSPAGARERARGRERTESESENRERERANRGEGIREVGN